LIRKHCQGSTIPNQKIALGAVFVLTEINVMVRCPSGVWRFFSNFFKNMGRPLLRPASGTSARQVGLLNRAQAGYPIPFVWVYPRTEWCRGWQPRSGTKVLRVILTILGLPRQCVSVGLSRRSFSEGDPGGR